MQHTSLNARLTVGHLDAEEKLKGGAMKPFGVTLLILLASLTDVKGDCPDVNGLENMDLEIEGNTLIYTCRHGHNLVPSYLRENYCMADSYWSAPHPVCERVSCGRPPTMNTLGCYGTNDFCPAGGDSEYTSRDYQYGDPVKFICKPGYWISATQLRSTETNCLHDGTWSKPYIECEEIRCQLPDQGDWKNKQKIQDFFDYSYDDPHFSEFDEVIVRCPEYTTMVDGGEEGMLNLCQEGGTWEKSFPNCGADCICPVNTTCQCKETTERQVRRYPRRYPRYRTVQEVTWVDCTAARFLHGEERKVKCSDNRFELQDGLYEMLVKCYDGDLDPKPTCTPKKCNKCRGCDSYTRTDHANTWNVLCEGSYRKTINQVTCKFGDWTGEYGTTVAEPCTDTCLKPVLSNGNILSNSNIRHTVRFPAAPNTYLQYACDEGYEPKNRRSRCLRASFFPSPECTPKGCSPCVGCNGANKTPHDQTFEGSCRDSYMPSRYITTCRYGVWVDEEPCKRVCNRPSNIIDDHGFTLDGEKFNVSCQTGFDLFQNGRIAGPLASMTCNAYGTWSPSYECKEQWSGPRPAHVRKDTWEMPVKHLDTLHYKCEAGYKAHHGNGVKNENGEMQQPVCDPKPCNKCRGCYSYIGTFGHGSTWDVSCEGSFRKTIDKVTCQLGDWTNVEPCTDTCPKPTLTNGDINGATLPNSYTHGSFPAAPDSRLLYSCAEGYQKEYPNRDIKCIAASFSPPSCIKNPCPICDGCVLDTELPSGRSWPVRCLNGWMKEEGQDMAACENSAWNPRQPCKRFCSIPSIPDSREHTKTLFVNESIQIICKRKRKMVVSESTRTKKLDITCNQTSSNGMATILDPDPTNLACYLSCDMDDVTNGQWRSGGESRDHTETAQYQCNGDFVAGTDTNVTCHNGIFVPQPKCLLEPCDLTDVDGMRDKTLLERGDQRSVECQEGYKSTVSHVKCEAGKTLSEQTPCVRYCPLQQVENAENHDIDPDIGALISISCKPGFELSPVSNVAVSTSVLCQHDGTFGDMTIPTCIDPNAHLHDDEGTYCNRTAFADYYVDGEKWNGCKVRPSNNITLECIADGVRYGTLTKHSVTCGGDGQWNQTITCKPRDCQCPRNVDPNTCFHQHGELVNFGCRVGRYRHRHIQIECEDGEWQPAVCTDERIVRCGCSPPSHYKEIRVGDTVWSNVSKLIAVGEVNIKCLHNGTDDISTRNNTCLPSGKWAEEIQCMKRECKVPEESIELLFWDESLNGTIWMNPGDTVSYGHSGYFNCVTGHNVPNKCLPGGAWEKQVPKCCGGCAVPEASQVGNPTYTYQGGDRAGDPGTEPTYSGDLGTEPVPHRRWIRYRCPGAQGENPITVTCTHGIWDKKIQCQPSSAPSTTPPIPTTVMPIPPVQQTTETQGTSGGFCVANHPRAQYQEPPEHMFQPEVTVADGSSVRWQCLLNPNSGQMQCNNGEWNSDSLDNLLEKCP